MKNSAASSSSSSSGKNIEVNLSEDDSMDDSNDDGDDEVAGKTSLLKKITTVVVTDQGPSEMGDYFMDRAKYIPLRLDLSERKKLRLLEAALNVSEYTDKVDILSYNSKAKRIHAQLRDICAILCGLVVASDYNVGQALIKSHDFCEFAEFFQDVFETGRRYKIMNPGLASFLLLNILKISFSLFLDLIG
jgi:hypothetical protein